MKYVIDLKRRELALFIHNGGKCEYVTFLLHEQVTTYDAIRPPL